MTIKRNPVQRLRRWLSGKLIQAATYVDDVDPDIEDILAKVQASIDEDQRIQPANVLVRPMRPVPIVEPVWDGSRKSTVDVLLHVAILVDQGHINNFALNWLGPPNEPTSRIQWPPDVGQA